MTFKSYREESRANYGTPQESLGLEQLRTGALLRIADASEAMAKNHVELTRQRDNFERWWKEAQARVNRLTRSNAALRGVIKRMKGKSK